MDQKKIVVADAGEEFRRLLVELMEQETDLRVVGDTADGAELVELCRQYQPDIVVMDMILSTLDGVDALTQLGELTPKPKVLVLSSFAGGRIGSGQRGGLLPDEALPDILRGGAGPSDRQRAHPGRGERVWTPGPGGYGHRHHP